VNSLANLVGALNDLDRCSSSWDQYELMRIPSLLRLLLIDGLTDQANREFRQRIRYRIGAVMTPRRDDAGHIIPSKMLFGSVGDSFDPDCLEGVQVHGSYSAPAPRDVTRDELLKQHVIVAGGHYFTVQEVIESLGYVQGLIHPGNPETQADADFLGWRQVMQLGGVGAGLREIRSIGRVVHRALVPLRDAVLAKYAPAV
jgi:hypothetical protein